MSCPCPFPSTKKHSLLLLVAAAAGAAAAVGVMSACSSKGPVRPDVSAVDHVVLERYAGVWYEIARLPNRFQKQCACNIKAEYTLIDAGMKVRNSCTRADGKTDTANGIAKVVPGSGNAKLRLSFFGPFYGDYWILALDHDYEWALVGSPDRKFLWILSRTPQLAEGVLQGIIARAAELGFATDKLEFTPQTDVQYPRSYTRHFF